MLHELFTEIVQAEKTLDELKAEYKNYCGIYVESERINDTEAMDSCKSKIADLIYHAMFAYNFDLETIDISDCI